MASLGVATACTIKEADGDDDDDRGSGGASAGGASSGGGSSGGGGSGSGGTSGGGSSAGGTGGGNSGGAGNDDGGTGTGAADGGPEGGDGTVVDTCGSDGDNDTNEKAVSLAGTMSFCLPDDDVDVFKLVAPADKPYRAHIEVDQADGARARVRLLAASDDSEIGEVRFAEGTREYFDVLVGAGTTTYLTVTPYLGSGETTFTLTWTAEADAQEPNDERGEAATVAKNTDIEAQLWERYTAANDQVADDWYSVELTTSPTTVKFTAVPENLRFRTVIYDPDGVQVGNNHNAPNPGAVHSFQFTPSKAGVYKVGVSNYLSGSFTSLYRNETPKSLAETYTLRIEQ